MIFPKFPIKRMETPETANEDEAPSIYQNNGAVIG